MHAKRTHTHVCVMRAHHTDPHTHTPANTFHKPNNNSDQGAQLVINPIQSARLRTTGTFNFKYGRLEVEAKLPRGVRALRRGC